jgi:hypothetical protein
LKFIHTTNDDALVKNPNPYNCHSTDNMSIKINHWNKNKKKKKKKNKQKTNFHCYIIESGSSTIICPNLREFGHVIVRDYLWDSLDRISGWATQFLFD